MMRTCVFAVGLVLGIGLSGCGRPAGAGEVPAALVGSWFAGSGGLSAPYDPNTGSWGTPNGEGLVYLFRADGTYTRGFSSYASNGGCTSGFTAFANGGVDVQGDLATLTPANGHIQYQDTCAPRLDSDRPDGQLAVERLHVTQLAPDQVELRGDDGSSSVFRRLER